MLVRGPRGTPAVLGVLSEGSESCTGRDTFVRLDSIRPWLAERIPRMAPQAPCGGVDDRGACFGNIAVRCVSGAIVGEECTEPSVCAWSNARRTYTCLEAPDSPCGFVDQLGECDGERARICIEGTLVENDCAASGRICRRSTTSGLAGCEYD